MRRVSARSPRSPALASVVLALAALAGACVGTSPEPASATGSGVAARPLASGIPPAPPAANPPQGAPSAAGARAPFASPDPLCQAACRSPLTDDLHQALATAVATTRRCFEQLRLHDPGAQVKLKVELRVSAGAGLCRVRVNADPGVDRAFAGCVQETFERAALPAFPDGCVNLALPIQFASKPPDSDAGPP